MNAVHDLKARAADYKQQHPDLHARELAKALGVHEAELVAARVGDDVVRLGDDYPEMIRELGKLGPVKTITRNENAVVEKWGGYEATDFSAHMGQVVGPIDLRIFLRSWRYAFAMDEAQHTKNAMRVRRSLQFFDASGDAIHKVYLEPTSDAVAWQSFIDRFRASEQSTAVALEPPPVADAEKSDADIDVSGFRTAWEAMQDTHDFFLMMRSFGVTRPQALRLAPPGRVVRVNRDALTDVLFGASKIDLPIMVFVGNRGLIQIHTGPVHRVKVLGPWVNVLDPEFNLHVREDAIHSAFVVSKPTRDGDVTALELFDERGELIAQLFGRRKPGQHESREWRAILAGLPPFVVAEAS